MAHIMCGGCGQHLMYPRSAKSVFCASCKHITPTALRLDEEGRKQMVVIQNPDESSADALVVGFAPGSREALAANVAAQDVPPNSADTS